METGLDLENDSYEWYGLEKSSPNHIHGTCLEQKTSRVFASTKNHAFVLKAILWT